MMGRTHVTIGVAAGLAVAYATGQTQNPALTMAGIAAIAALLPDIDHPKSSIRQRAGIAGHIALFWLPHRGFTHTLLALAGIAAIALAYAPRPLALAIVAGYASHILADLMTQQGLPVLWPLVRRNIHLPPGLRTGGWLEQLVWLLAVGAIAILTTYIL